MTDGQMSLIEGMDFSDSHIMASMRGVAPGDPDAESVDQGMMMPEGFEGDLPEDMEGGGEPPEGMSEGAGRAGEMGEGGGRAGGMGDGGGMPADGMVVDGLNGSSSEQDGSQSFQAAGARRGMGFESNLLNMLIRYLESFTGAVVE